MASWPMELWLAADGASDQYRSGGARDLHREGRRNRRRRDDGEAGACRLERKLSRDPSSDQQDEPVECSSVEECGADHFVDGVVASDVLGVMQQLLAIGERGGVDAARLLVSFATR